MNTGSIGTAKLNLTVDTTEFVAQVNSARSITNGLGTEAATAFTQANLGARRASESLLKYVQGLGQGVDEQKLLNAAMKGVPTAVLVEAKDAILSQRDATRQAEIAQKSLNAARQQGASAAADVFKQYSDQQAFIKGLQQQTAAIGKTRAELLEMKAAQLGVSQAAAPHIAQLKAQEAALAGVSRNANLATRELNAQGLSAKQVTAAMRGVPAQITDIFVSLQGGQNPITVLLQQGGQLKDMFGGIVPAARALGGSLLALVNPFTVTAAVAAGLFAALYAAGERVEGFNKALILSGNISAQTADDLQRMALALDNVTGVTANQAADALTQIAATGRIAADQYELVAEAAARMEDVTGKAMKDTIAEYVEIQRDPVNAILKLNESENFLTASVLERIRTLQESGQIEAAAAAATEARATAQIQRTQEVVESLGLISGAWFHIKENTGEAWDEAVNYFSNLDKEAKSAAQTLGSMWDALKMGGPATGFALMSATSGGMSSTTGAKAATDAQKKVNAEAERALTAIIAGNRTKEEQQKLEITRIRNLGKEAGRSAEEIEKMVAASNKAYEASKPKGRTGGVAALANAERAAALQAIKDQLAVEQTANENQTRMLQAQYSARLVSSTDYYARLRTLQSQNVENEATALQKQIAYLKERDLKGKDSVNVLRQIGGLETRLAKVRADGATQLAILGVQEQDVADKRTRAIDSYRDSLARSNDAARQSADAALARITMGQREAEQQQKVAEVYQQSADKQRELAREFAENRDQEMYDTKLNDLREFTDEQVRIINDTYSRMQEAQSNWLNGVNAGVQDWITKASDVATATADITKRVLDGATDAVVNYASGTKDAFKQLLADILKEIARFLIKKAVSQFLQVLAGSFSGGGGGASFSAQGSANNFSGSLPGYAMGGAFQTTPSLAAMSGSVVNKATPFYFAKGAALGVAGEAGHEGILPLERGPDGRLGVLAMGGGGGGMGDININTYLTTSGQSNETSTGSQTAALAEFNQRLRTTVREEVNMAMRQGGSLWRAGVGQ